MKKVLWAAIIIFLYSSCKKNTSINKNYQLSNIGTSSLSFKNMSIPVLNVTTYIGQSTSGIADGSFGSATLRRPRYLKWDIDSTLYFVEEGERSSGNGGVRFAKNNLVQTIVRNTSSGGLFDRIRAISQTATRDSLLVANDIKDTGTASIGIGLLTLNNGVYSNLGTLWAQTGITCVDLHPITGEIFTAIYSGGWIYKFGAFGFSAMFQLPGSNNATPMNNANVSSIVFDKNEGTTAYIVVRDKHVVYKATYSIASGTFTNVHLFVGKIGFSGYADGSDTSARFNNPCQADIDKNGNLYVADRSNNCIRKVTPEGLVSTYAGLGPDGAGFSDGDQTTAMFNKPEGCQFGPDGALYVADYENNRIRKIKPEDVTIKTMTYNTYSNRKEGIQAIADVIIAANPDLVSLQEVERNTDVNPTDVPKTLSELTGMPYYYFAKAIDLAKGDYGNAILSKYPLTDTVTYTLPLVVTNGAYIRSLGMAKIQKNGKFLYFATTHLDHISNENRVAQVNAIYNYTSNLSAPVILGGDFNSHPDQVTIQTITQWYTLGCLNAVCGYTAPTPVPSYTIDYLMYYPSTGCSTIAYQVDTSANSQSDHFPVVATFKIN